MVVGVSESGNVDAAGETGHIMADAVGRDMRLSTTRSGYWLYESEGFVPLVTKWQHQGIARPFSLPAPLIKAQEGEFVRLDTPVESKAFEAFLSAGRLGVYDTVTETYRGRQRRTLPDFASER